MGKKKTESQQSWGRPAYSEQVYTSKSIKYCPDGKYRWTYELNMYRNPSILFVVLKIFGLLMAIPFYFMLIHPLLIGETWEHTWDKSKYAVLCFSIFFLCVFLSYFLLAAMLGGKYVVEFEMDDEGVLHTQKKGVEKTKKLGWLTVLAGLASKRPGTVGLGLSVANRTSSYSDFLSVRNVKRYRKRNLIKVNELLYRNQVYVEDEDFDFVYDYIRTRCPRVMRKENLNY
ncbi:MAG: hypothetical protein J5529_10490 [Prevotella sp.]|nr:hypothetical protein [Prevotella sp.]